jgi:Spy/CpxP family protein refolding chaperone
MKKMIRMAIMTAAMFVAVATIAKAQDAGQQQGGRRGGRGGVTALLKGITLTPAQQTSVDSIQKAFSEKNAPLMEAMRGGDADARSKMMENRKAQTDAVKAVLTDDQKKVFDENVANMPQRGGRPPVSL